MKTVTFTEFRQQASHLLSEVERGETYTIIRYGKPIAEITPYAGAEPVAASWKRPGLRLESKGAALSEAILAERSEAE